MSSVVLALAMGAAISGGIAAFYGYRASVFDPKPGWYKQSPRATEEPVYCSSYYFVVTKGPTTLREKTGLDSDSEVLSGAMVALRNSSRLSARVLGWTGLSVILSAAAAIAEFISI